MRLIVIDKLTREPEAGDCRAKGAADSKRPLLGRQPTQHHAA